MSTCNGLLYLTRPNLPTSCISSFFSINTCILQWTGIDTVHFYHLFLPSTVQPCADQESHSFLKIELLSQSLRLLAVKLTTHVRYIVFIKNTIGPRSNDNVRGCRSKLTKNNVNFNLERNEECTGFAMKSRKNTKTIYGMLIFGNTDFVFLL